MMNTEAKQTELESKKELARELSERIRNFPMQVMILTVMPRLLVTGLKTEEPELYYSIKSSLRDLHSVLVEAVPKVEGIIAEL